MQSSVLDSSKFPVQLFPPLLGSGESQFRLLVNIQVPPPQDTEQSEADQLDHAPKPPFTEVSKRSIKREYFELSFDFNS